MSDFDNILSPAGRSRRDEILALAKRQARLRRRRRNIARWTAPALAVICMVGIVWRFNREQMNVPVPIARSHFLTPESPAISIAQIKTDPNITARLAVRSSPHWERIGDDELLHSLADAGQPAGLIQMKDHAVLVTSDVPQ